MILVFALGCSAEPTFDVCAAPTTESPQLDAGWTGWAHILGDAELAPSVRARFHAPRAGARALTAAVVLHGSWEDAGIAADAPIVDAPDVVTVQLDYPGGGGSEGVGDRRGASARAAVAAVLGWAAGTVVDSDGCTLPTRAPGVAGPPVLVGASNGGNLAVASLADPALALPELAGVVTWETPSDAAFATVAYGNDPTVYTPDTCVLDDDGAVSCAVPDRVRLARSSEGLCFDVGFDGGCDAADPRVGFVRDPSGVHVYAPFIATLIEESGIVDDAMSRADTDLWWAERSATRAAAAAVARWPDLPFLLLGSAEDHVLAWPDHAHVWALGEALQRAGARWTRLNPGTVDGWEPNPVDLPLRLDDRQGELLPEEAESPLDGLLGAAVTELAALR